MQDRNNQKWLDLMAVLGRHFTPEERAAGWPDSFKPEHIALLQRAFKWWPAKDREHEKAALYAAYLKGLNAALVRGEMPSIIKTERVVVDHKNVQIGFTRRRTWEGEVRTPKYGPAPVHGDKEVPHITAPAFAAWLTAQGLTPSPHILDWFEFLGVVVPDAVVAVTPAKDTKKHRDLLAPLVEAAQRACDNESDTSAVFTTLKAWAKEKEPRAPLMGVTEDGRIQWLDSNDTPKELDKESLAKRMLRQQKPAEPTPPGKQIRRIK
jgi:hypothetical protein